MDENVFKEIREALDKGEVFAAVYRGKKAVLIAVQEHAAEVRATAQGVFNKKAEDSKRVYDAAIARAKDTQAAAINRAQVELSEAVREQEATVYAAQEELTKAESELQTVQHELKAKFGIDIGAAPVVSGSTRL